MHVTTIVHQIALEPKDAPRLFLEVIASNLMFYLGNGQQHLNNPFCGEHHKCDIETLEANEIDTDQHLL